MLLGEDKKNVNVTVDKTTFQSLQKICREQNTAMSTWIRELIQRELNEKHQKPT